MEGLTLISDYLDAFYSGDEAATRRYLADSFSFVGPGASYGTPDDFLRLSGHIRGMVKGVRRHKLIQDGPDVGAFYELLIEHPVGSVAIADWYHIEDGRITSLRTVFDTGPFVAPPALAEDRAVDPVCHMAVERESAAATHVFEGTTYYFCSRGCAETFTADPARYVSP